MVELSKNKQQSLRLPVVVIGLLAVSIALGIRASNVALIIFLCYALSVGWKTLVSPPVSQWRLLLPALLYVAYLIGYIWSENSANAARELERKIFLLACPAGLLLVHNKITREDIAVIFKIFLSAIFVLSVICYYGAIENIVRTGSLTVVETTERQYYYFTYLHLTSPVNIDPIYMSLFSNFCVMLLLADGFKNKLLNFALIIHFAVFIILVNAKIGLAAFVLIVVLFLFFRLKSRFTALLIGAVLVATLLTTVLNASFLADRFRVNVDFDFSAGYAGDWNSVSQRLAIWTCAKDAAEQTFPWGNGTGDGQEALVESYRKFNYYRGHQDNINAHSEYLQTQLDLGLAGTLCLAAILFIPLLQGIKQKHFLLIGFVLIIAMYFLVEVVFARRYGVLFFSLFYGLLSVRTNLIPAK